jgi:hypothetical protein
MAMTKLERNRLCLASTAAVIATCSGLAAWAIAASQGVDQENIAAALGLALLACLAAVAIGAALYPSVARRIGATRGDHFGLAERFSALTVALGAVATLATDRLIVATSIAGAFFGMRYVIAEARNKIGREPIDVDTSLRA